MSEKKPVKANTPEEAEDVVDRADVERLILMLRRSQNDEETGGAVFGALMARYLPLIEKTVDRFADGQVSDADREDLRQEALLSFYRAALSYDVTQPSVTFGLYAQICMMNRLVSCMRRLKRLEETVPLLLRDEIAIPADVAALSDPTASIAAEERLENTYAVIRRVLSPFEFQVWEYYVGGISAKEIGETLEKSEKSISNAIGRIRKKLKAARKEFDF